MPNNEDEGPKKALIISAHPDDSEFGAAGTAYLWTQEGWEFHYLICTDGSKGTEDPEMTPDKLVPLRQKEQREAVAIVGGKDVQFLDFVDGELRYTPDFMREVVRAIRTIKPFAVFSHDPNQIVRNAFINHPDHRCAGEVALDAVYPIARNGPSFPELRDEGLAPFSVSEVYLWTASDVNCEIDITDAMPKKLEALSKHKSQIADFDGTAERVKKFWQNDEGRFVERFRKIELAF